jgi:redox-sensitive bicupin YhaK (pirin superfamily)
MAEAAARCRRSIRSDARLFDSPNARDYTAGFPQHPHHGFETVTYMLNGWRHRDNHGGEGLIEPAACTDDGWSRIVHSEMPEQSDGLMRGFQLWVNLPARQKMTRRAIRSTDLRTSGRMSRRRRGRDRWRPRPK